MRIIIFLILYFLSTMAFAQQPAGGPDAQGSLTLDQEKRPVQDNAFVGVCTYWHIVTQKSGVIFKTENYLSVDGNTGLASDVSDCMGKSRKLMRDRHSGGGDEIVGAGWSFQETHTGVFAHGEFYTKTHGPIAGP